MDQRRRWQGVTDDGRTFTLLFTSKGVRWSFVEEEAKADIKAPTGSNRERFDSDARINAALNSAAGLASSSAQLINAVTGVLVWWEARQTRLMNEAMFEEQRRVPWTYDMMGRWVEAHREGSEVDLEVSHYLGRETAQTLVALSQNRKMAVPQAMLYELEQIRRVISATRTLLVRQFTALERAEDFNINAILSSAFGGPKKQSLTVNFNAIRRWGADPALDWERCLAKNDLKSFEAEFKEMHKFPQKLMEMALGFVPTPTSNDQPANAFSIPDATSPFWIALAVSSVRGASPLVPLALTLIPAAASAVFELVKDGDLFRRDDFKELALVTAEIERTRLLHRLWCLFDGAVRHTRRGGLLVQEASGVLTVTAPDHGGRFQEVARLELLPQAASFPSADS